MQSTPNQCIRESRMFKGLPWKTNTPITLDPLDLPDAIHMFRLALEKGEHNESDNVTAAYCTLENENPNSLANISLFPLGPHLTQIKRAQIGSSAIKYLLIDTVSWQFSGPVNEQGATVKRGKLPTKSHLPYRPLEVWSHTMLKAWEALSDKLDNTRMQGDGFTPEYFHLMSIYQNSRGIHALKIISNMETAAMHLRFLLEGNTDLPKDKNDFVAYLKKKNPPDSHPMIEKAMESISMGNLRHPLHVALAISPMSLLANTSLVIHSASEDKFCEMWTALGGSRPQLIRDIELRIWTIVWNHATCGVNLQNCLKKTTSDIVKMLEHPVDREALRWFNEHPHIPENESDKVSQRSLNYDEEEEDEGDDGDEVGGQRNSITSEAKNTGTASQQPDGSGLENDSDVQGREGARSDTTHMASIGNEGDGDDRDTQQNQSNNGWGENQDVYEEPRGLREDINAVQQNNNPLTGQEIRRSTRTVKKRPGSTQPEGTKLARPEKRTRNGRVKIKMQPRQNKVPPYHEVIIIEDDEDGFGVPDLEEIEGPQRQFESKPYRLFPLDGSEPLIHTATFHRLEDATWFNSMMEAVEKLYKDGKPLHLDSPSDSIFRLISYDDFLAMDDGEVQKILSTQHILLKEGPKPKYYFDLRGLETLAPLDRPIVIHDLSIPVEENHNVRQMSGTLMDIFNASVSSGGKSLNSLDFPMPFSNPPPTTIASEVTAWTYAFKTAKKGEQYPSTTTRWGLVATSGAYHAWHIDADGLGTYVSCKTGSKLWFMARPKAASQFAGRKLFQGPGDYQAEGTNADRWDIEAAYLTPGTLLIMRPNTPHAVYTPAHAICHGGHYIATSTIRDTCYGIFHTFAATSIVTNTEHTLDSRLLLRKLMTMYSGTIRSRCTSPLKEAHGTHCFHVPPVETFEGLLDILSLHNILELAHVINPKMYGPSTELYHRERHSTISGREISRDLVETLFSYYDLVDEDGNAVDAMTHLVWPYLAQQAKCLLAYKAEAMSRQIYSENLECNFGAMYNEMQKYFVGNTGLIEAFNKCERFESFAWAGASWGIQRKKEPKKPASQDGFTFSDDVWLGNNSLRGCRLPILTIPGVLLDIEFETNNGDGTGTGNGGFQGDSEDDSDEPLAQRRRISN